MGEPTDRFQLDTLGPGDSLADNGYKFGKADRQFIDRALEYVLERHVHAGGAASDATPELGPVLTLHTTGGTIPASTRVHYRYSFIDAYGFESAASPLTFVDTPAQVNTPAPPSLVATTTGGSLPPGTYVYAITAYASATTLETKTSAPINIRLATDVSTSKITVDMPSIPTGADGFNIYRRKPGSPRFYFLASITGTSYVDDGSDTEDVTRSLPISNTTNNINAVTISLPGATPTVPAGHTWRLYRSFQAIDWNNTFLQWVIETATEDGGPVVTSFDDVGEPTSVGNPPTTNQAFGSPPKIDLTDMANVTGVLPPGVNVVCHVVSFHYPGAVAAQEGPDVWVCNFTKADIVACRAYLGRGSTPASQDVIVDVNKYDAHAATPSWQTIYTTQANRPRVTTGAFLGTRTTPDVIHLLQGDALSVDIDQAGGGATPTDHDLVVDVLMYIAHGSTSTSYVWA